MLRAPASRPAPFTFQKMRLGSTTSWWNSSDFPRAVTTIRSTQSRRRSNGRSNVAFGQGRLFAGFDILRALATDMREAAQLGGVSARCLPPYSPPDPIGQLFIRCTKSTGIFAGRRIWVWGRVNTLKGAKS